MDKKEKIVVVTWDFTEISHFALAHAEKFAKASDAIIHCLHINSSKNNEEELTEKMQKEIDQNKIDSTSKIYPIVKEGKIFSGINEYAKAIDAELVIMGTHGRIGVQKIFGSKALKVIVGSKIPFLTVQDMPQSEIQELVLPFDASLEVREKMKWVVYFAEKYKLKVRILKKVMSLKDLQQRINTNISFAKRIMTEHNIPFEIDLETNIKDFAEETIEFATKISASLIMVMTTNQPDITDYMFGAEEQKIIANSSKIPVICINPRNDLRKPVPFN